MGSRPNIHKEDYVYDSKQKKICSLSDTPLFIAYDLPNIPLCEVEETEKNA